MSIIRRNATCSSDITQTIAKFIHELCLSRNETDIIQFDFNDVIVRVNMRSDPAEIYKAWNYGMYGLLKVAGPGKAPDLDAELAVARAEAEARRVAYAKEAAAKQAALDARIDAEIGDEQMLFCPGGEEKWLASRAVNQDWYGKGVLDYAERWAVLMQVRMKDGSSVEAVSSQASYDADSFGMSGMSASMGRSMLVHCWIYGDQLKSSY